MTGKTIVVGKFAHESNTFSSVPTDRAAFEEYQAYSGAEMIENLQDTNSEIGGFIEVATEEGVDLVPSISANASPGGPVTEDAYEYYTGRILDTLREYESQLDGVALALHGAMVTEERIDGEGPFLSRVREIVGPETPVGVTLDLHGNLSDELIEKADILVSFETYPHVDASETGRTVMTEVLRAARGETDPTMHCERPPVLPEEPFEDTNDGPMVEVMDRARELERRDDILKVNVFFGFHQVDNPTMGFSVPVVSDGNPDAAREAARELSALVWENRRAFIGDYPEAPEAIHRANELVDAGTTADGPVVMADLGPNAAAGGTADGTVVLRELLRQDVTNAGYAIVRDPESVAACLSAGVGETVTLTLGGKTDDRHGDPIEDVDCYVKAITDGTFVKHGPMDRGTVSHLGRTVLVECGAENGLSVILTENLHSPRDAGIWRHVGIQPERLDILVVHGTNHFRADYLPLASEVYVIDSPGIGSPIPTRYDYQNIDRPKFPLDEMADDAYPTW